MMRVRGQVTVFLSLIFLCVFSLLCGLLESARTAGARHYLQTAASSALDSVFSQYHRQLWDSYRLLFAEYEEASELRADFEQFLLPYLETENWYPIKLESTDVEEWLLATDDNGSYLEQEILDYMRYGIWNLDVDGTQVDEAWKRMREADAVKAVAADYQVHARDVLKLERAIEAIYESQQEQRKRQAEGLSALRAYHGGAFQKSAKQLIQELKRMPGLVAAYRRQADALEAGLAASREMFSGHQEELGTSVQEVLEREIGFYETYVAQDGARRQEIEALEPQSAQQTAFVEAVMNQAKEVERIIDEWESDEDDDGPDLHGLWSPVIRRFEQFLVVLLSFSHGVKDKEKEGWLAQVIQMCRSGLLSLVIPEHVVLSNGVLERIELPSETEFWAEEGRNPSLVDRLMINEYCGQFFPDFLSAQLHDGETALQGLLYEMEYLLAGNDTDEENLGNTVARLLAVREGFNLIHILSDSQKREEASQLALAITGAAGVTPLASLTAFFIMTVWALGESIADIKGLLAGNKLSLIKSREEWTLSLERLLSMGKQGETVTGGGENGFDYTGWLKILLLMENIIRQEYRMMDMIQMNLCRKQENFRMRCGVYQVKTSGRLCGKRVFFSLGFVDKALGGVEHTYPMGVHVERVY